jgi:hypothetical protein
MSHKNQEFETAFTEKFRDMRDLFLQRLEAGIDGNEMKATFTENGIDGAIKFYSYAHGGGYNIQRFGKLFQEKIDLLTGQLFSALDKEIKGNKIKTDAKDGNLTCHITIKTTPHEKPPIFLFGDESVPQKEKEEANQMFK